MYNDFAAAQSQAGFAAPTDTVLLSDSSPASGNASPSVTPAAGVLRNNVGHNVGDEILRADSSYWEQADIDDVSRHSGGGVFLMADGHAKWFKVDLNANTGIASKVFFGTRASSYPTGPSHNDSMNEPEPGGDMGSYAATFQIN